MSAKKGAKKALKSSFLTFNDLLKQIIVTNSIHLGTILIK